VARQGHVAGLMSSLERSGAGVTDAGWAIGLRKCTRKPGTLQRADQPRG